MFYGTECTLNTDRICLANGTDPGIQCSGIKFIGRNAAPMRQGKGVAQCLELIWEVAGEPLWGTTDLIWNQGICGNINFFDTDRGLCLLDYIVFNPADPDDPYLYDACEPHPIARTEVNTFIECINRFGGAKIERDITYFTGGNDYVVKTLYDYDELCVGYKTSNTGETPLDMVWMDNPSSTYAIGIPQPSLDLPEGPCTGNEKSVMYTIAADPSNCDNVTSCIEIKTLECVADPSTVYGVDPYCPDFPPPPPTLFQDVLFCDVDADVAANLRHNAFCETDPEPLRINPVAARFCAMDVSLLVIDPVNVGFCELDENIIRGQIPQVAFCNYDASIILPPPPLTPSAYFCETNIEPLRLSPTSVRFCETDVISRVNFCEIDVSTIRNVDFVEFCDQRIPTAVPFCEQSRKTIDGVPEVQYCDVAKVSIESDGLTIVDFCEQKIATGVFFCEASGVPGIISETIQFCEQERNILDNVPNIRFCEYNRSVIDNVPNISFCAHNRQTIDNVADVSYCEHDRRTIDNVTDIPFCETPRTEIDGAGDVQFCEYKRSTLP